MECFIHYDDSNESELTQITEKTKNNVLISKTLHEEKNDEHSTKLSNINLENCNYYYHTNCYKKYVKIKELKDRKDKKVKSPIPSSIKIPSRSKRKRLSKGLSPPKRQREFQSPPPNYRLRSNDQSRSSCTTTSPNITSPNNDNTASTNNYRIGSPSKFIFGSECVICNKYELRYKINGTNHREKPLNLTLITAADVIKESARKKPKYIELWNRIIDVDLVAAEFKYHDKCHKELTRPLKDPLLSKPQQIGNFDRIVEHINKYVLDLNQVVSMQNALLIYMNLDISDDHPDTIRKRRSRLKEKLLQHYTNEILILETKPNSWPVIINAKNIQNQTILSSDKDRLLETAAKYLRHDIKSYCEKLPETNWPPTIEMLTTKERALPLSITNFLTNLLKPSGKPVTDNLSRKISSLAYDFIHFISRGVVLTPKHFLLGLGLHSLTGQKKVVQLVSKLGHCITYDKVLDIETAQARKAQEIMLKSSHSILPLRPESPNDKVVTVFWVDNFDKILDREIGGGALNITTMMGFQEKTKGAVKNEHSTIDLPKTKSHMLNEVFFTLILYRNMQYTKTQLKLIYLFHLFYISLKT